MFIRIDDCVLIRFKIRLIDQWSFHFDLPLTACHRGQKVCYRECMEDGVFDDNTKADNLLDSILNTRQDTGEQHRNKQNDYKVTTQG